MFPGNRFFCVSMFVRSYLDTAATIIGEYDGREPLANFLKKYFAAQRKYGSRDRKQITQLVYGYYRTGRSLQQSSIEQQLLAGLFLCSQNSQPVLQQTKPEWNELVSTSLEQKMALLQSEVFFNPAALFPFTEFLSAEINVPEFTRSFLVQPDTFLRLRPGGRTTVLQQLDDAGINYQVLAEQAIAVPPAARLDDLLMLDKDAVVQDISSQKVLSLLQPFAHDFQKPFSTWDCCAASGGKSLLLHDLFPASLLTVSDIRSSILQNLRKRFERAGIRRYQWFVGDLSNPKFEHKTEYNLVICDAPCSGSGTWARTPEWLHFFTAEKLAHYAALQQKIAIRAIQNIRPGGYFLYITCSVFRPENEDVVSLLQQAGMQLVQMQYFSGYALKGDTLFAALFRK